MKGVRRNGILFAMGIQETTRQYAGKVMDVGVAPGPLRAAARVLWLTVGAIAVIAVVYRWDRVGTLNDVRWQVALTAVGLALGAWLASMLARGLDRFGRSSRVGLLCLIISQVCYLLLVWTQLKTETALWRVWWLSVVASVTITHITWLRLTAAIDRRTLMRVTIGAAIWCACLLGSMALRPVMLADPFPGFAWILGVPMALSTIVTIGLWARGVRYFRGGVPRGVKIGWAVVAGIVLVAVGFYAGRVTAPGPDLFGHQFSPLARMSNEELQRQTTADFQTLKALSARLVELEARSTALAAEWSAANASRSWMTPEAETQLRSLFISYLSCRDELLRLVALHGGYDTVQDPQARARCVLIGHASGAMVYEYGLKLVRWFGPDERLRAKLNEADPRWGVPSGMYDRIYDNVANPANTEALAEISGYVSDHREQWLRDGVFAGEEFTWITGQIARSTDEIKALQLHPIGARWEQALARVRQHAYTPMYTTQSVLSTWIGDTRLIQWESLISFKQIEEMKSKLEPGDILLERRSWFLSNAFLPGFWPHSAMYVGDAGDLERLGVIRKEGGAYTSDDPNVRRFLSSYLERAADGHAHTVIESVSEGVIFNSLAESMHADYVAVLRPRLSAKQKATAIARCFAHIGKPYDFDFDIGTTDKLVCSELVYQAYADTLRFDKYIQKVVGRDALPPLEIARKYLDERDLKKRELDFVLFLDGYPSRHEARLADEKAFCATVVRPRGFTQ